jgi:hypothetical protein
MTHEYDEVMNSLESVCHEKEELRELEMRKWNNDS